MNSEIKMYLSLAQVNVNMWLCVNELIQLSRGFGVLGTGKNKTDVILGIDKANKYTVYKTNNIDVITDISLKGINKKLASDIFNREILFIQSYLGLYPFYFHLL